MFTGIIKSIGKVVESKAGYLEVEHDLRTIPGDSIAVNGVCLTVNRDGCFDVMDETLGCTNIGSLKTGDTVNLEPGMSLADKIDGHLVSGHVDFVSEVVSFDGTVLEVAFPADYARFFAAKGSVAINGVSLTVTDVSENTLSVSLVGFTLDHTNLGSLTAGCKVNIEVDLIARYLDRIVSLKK